MSLYIPQMSDTPAITIPGLASNFNALADSRIVEYGSNENGQYWRWENGLQVCRHYYRIYSDNLRPADDTVAEFYWYFPVSFRGVGYRLAPQAAYVSATLRRGIFDQQMVSVANLPTPYTVTVDGFTEPDRTLFAVYFPSKPALTSDRFATAMMFAIGRWK